MVHRVEATIGGRTMSLETGKLAQQADGSVLVRYGDTIVLSTVTASRDERPDQDFFPLTVDYEEKMYAAGKIPGGFIKRESRPSEHAILTARLTDRPIRPLFPKGFKKEVQVVCTVLSTDQENDPDILSIIGASAAISISQLPFAGPVGAVRVGYDGQDFVINPPAHDIQAGMLDLVVGGTRNAVIMVEGSAEELPEEQMFEAIQFAHREMQAVIDLQEELVKLAGKEKEEFIPPPVDEEAICSIRDLIGDRLWNAINCPDKATREGQIDELKDVIVSESVPLSDDMDEAESGFRQSQAAKIYESLVKETVRNAILQNKARPDGRAPDEIRPITVEIGLLPRAHGSGLFTRGQTQVLTVLTLGSTNEEQILDTIGIEESKRYIHHYNFPPYSTGEVKRMRGPGRREIGHGALAERALEPVIPDQDEFPYVLRLVSEVLSSNGSSSMASVCGSTLALLDGGVPIKKPVAGIAMGLVTDDQGNYTVLSDIQGMEDFLGDMDFKVAGTDQGVTAMQMDVKATGIAPNIMMEAFKQAKDGRLFILGKMNEVISQPREEMSEFAPRITRIQIDPEKIGTVIGPGGKMIRSIIEQTGAKIDVEDDGSVFIATADQESCKQAVRMIEGLTKEAKVGEIYLGKVVRIMPYGAFVQILPGKDGLVHISELDEGRVEKVEDVVDLGDEINVMVTDIDSQGKISLSRRAVLTGQMPAPKTDRPRGPRPGGDRGGDRGPRGPRR